MIAFCSKVWAAHSLACMLALALLVAVPSSSVAIRSVGHPDLLVTCEFFKSSKHNLIISCIFCAVGCQHFVVSLRKRGKRCGAQGTNRICMSSDSNGNSAKVIVLRAAGMRKILVLMEFPSI